MSTHKIKIVAGFTDRNDNLDVMFCNETQFDLAPKICQHKFSHGKKLVYENRQIWDDPFLADPVNWRDLSGRVIKA